MPYESERRVAYFSMEIAVAPEFPTYAGGLGVLAGDMLRSAADLEIPMVGVTLLHRQGYFHQQLDGVGRQSERPEEWHPEDVFEPIAQTVPLVPERRANQRPSMAILDKRSQRFRSACLFSGHGSPRQSGVGANADE